MFRRNSMVLSVMASAMIMGVGPMAATAASERSAGWNQPAPSRVLASVDESFAVRFDRLMADKNSEAARLLAKQNLIPADSERFGFVVRSLVTATEQEVKRLWSIDNSKAVVEVLKDSAGLLGALEKYADPEDFLLFRNKVDSMKLAAREWLSATLVVIVSGAKAAASQGDWSFWTGGWWRDHSKIIEGLKLLRWAIDRQWIWSDEQRGEIAGAMDALKNASSAERWESCLAQAGYLAEK